MKKIIIVGSITVISISISILIFMISFLKNDPEFKMENCKQEINRFCANEKTDGTQIRSCLAKYNKMLSSECKRAVESNNNNKPHPCEADAKKFCSDIKPGGGRIIACLVKNAGKLSPECKRFGAERKVNVQP